MAAHKRLPDTKHSRGWILKTIRRYLLFSTNGVPSNVCAWGWHLHCCDVGSCTADLWTLFPQVWQKHFFFLVLSYFHNFGKSISYFLKLVQSMLKLSRGVGEFVFAHVGYFLTKNAYVQPSKNSNDKIVSTHTKCVSLVEFHFSF